jgi:hypothetical protein
MVINFKRLSWWRIKDYYQDNPKYVRQFSWMHSISRISNFITLTYWLSKKFEINVDQKEFSQLRYAAVIKTFVLSIPK